MPSLKKNIIANLIGRIWSAALSLLLIPVYIKFLGIESFGLIGFYTTILASLTILDFGLSTTLNRELARAKATQKPATEVRNLVFSLELIYWLIGVIIGVLVFFCATLMATYWVNAEQLSVQTVSDAIKLMGLVIMFQWPVSIYNGGLLGLEKQVLYNLIMVVMTSLRAAGVVILFIWIEPSIQLFFIWQAAISLLYVIWMRVALWSHLPASSTKNRFSVFQLKSIWKFATGMTGVGITAFFLAQVDKLILSKLLLLKHFGYYTLALALTSALGTLVGPIYTAVFPRFSALISLKDEEQLQKTHHNISKLVATIVFPIGIFMLFFAADILTAWTRDVITVQHTEVLVQISAIAAIFSCLVSGPIYLMQAYGNTRFIFLQNLVACMILVPVLFYLTGMYGAIGAAIVLLLLNMGYMFISMPLVNRFHLKGNIVRWFVQDNLVPMLPSLIFLGLIKSFIWMNSPVGSLNIFLLALILLFALITSGIFNIQLRHWVLHYVQLKTGRKIWYKL